MNSQIGLGVLINSLGGTEETAKAITEASGKVIQSCWLNENKLNIQFADGACLRVWDDGQSCCETRYMRTDDELTSIEGEVFIGLERKDASNVTDEYGEVHEVQFLDVITDRSRVQISNHNEHNGYYGGFWVAAEWA